jgi:hypothetical protein
VGQWSMTSRYEETDDLPLLMDLLNGEEEIASAFLVLEDECARNRRRRGSIPGHAVRDRQRLDGDYRLYRDYFAQSPIFDAEIFRRRCNLSLVELPRYCVLM